MAKTSGSNGGLPNGDSNYKGKIGKLEPLATIKNPKVYKAVKESISRFNSEHGPLNLMLAQAYTGYFKGEDIRDLRWYVS